MRIVVSMPAPMRLMASCCNLSTVTSDLGMSDWMIEVKMVSGRSFVATPFKTSLTCAVISCRKGECWIQQIQWEDVHRGSHC